ncbi:MAG: Pyridoxal phosphate homeostasis protein [Planctomycetes bacterium]|nr:Pyridoxal phosphate homeostasis protein [Planctomycetota bacterium]
MPHRGPKGFGPEPVDRRNAGATQSSGLSLTPGTAAVNPMDPEPSPTPSPSPADLRRNLAAVRSEIAAAARRAGRDPGDVRLIAVTKSAPLDAALALVAAGQADLAENRTSLLAGRRAAAEAAGLRATWHLIGHWQRNKVRRALASVDVFHALDSLELARVLAAEVARSGRPPLRCLVEVNTSGEATKGGFAPEAFRAAAPALSRTEGIVLEGLMTMAPASPDPEAARPFFRLLGELRDWARDSEYLRGSELSMGMSDDFGPAVEEGSTMVRIGRRLFMPGAR